MSSKQQTTGSTENNQPTPTAQKSGLSRRDLLRRSAVGATTVGGVSAGAIRFDHGPVQESEAIAPAVAAGGVGASAAVGWTLRETEILGSDSPPEGLTSGALQSQVFDTVSARASNNLSTIIDNKNIIDGIGHTAWADGKIAAIDALNEQSSESEVLDAAQSEVDDYFTTVQENLLKSWNESLRELYNLLEAQAEHEDLSRTTGFDANKSLGNQYQSEQGWDIVLDNVDRELANGSEMSMHQVESESSSSDEDYRTTQDPVDDGPADDERNASWVSITYSYDDRETDEYILLPEWQDIYSDIQDEYEDVSEGIDLWVGEIYGDVQSGDLDTEELLTPREQAELTSEDEDFPQAIADLRALNVSVDLEREAEIYLPDISATLYGQLAYSGEETLEVGEIDPDATDDDDEPLYPGTIYFNYDASQGQGEWDAYEDGIDGGTLTLTSEPFEDTIYYVDTTAGETAEFVTGDLTEDDDGDEWTIDLSDQLDEQITEVEQIEYYAETEETQYETIQLQEPFEIVTFTDSDGEEYEETNFERSEPHDDDNYITEEEWKEQQERHEELIEKYEDAQGGGSIPGVDDLLDGEANGLIGIAVVGVVLVSAILSALNPLS